MIPVAISVDYNAVFTRVCSHSRCDIIYIIITIFCLSVSVCLSESDGGEGDASGLGTTSVKMYKVYTE